MKQFREWFKSLSGRGSNQYQLLHYPKKSKLSSPFSRRLTLENLEERALLTTAPGIDATAAAEPSSTRYVVTTLADTVDKTDGALSLREAIVAASAGDTIIFAKSLAGGRILLSGAELTIEKGITIDASYAGGITIDAGGQSRVFNISGGTEATPVNLFHLTITRGSDYFNGGGIYHSAGTLTLTNCVITENAAYSGGGIYNSGTLTLTNCVIEKNSVGADLCKGGGIMNDSSGLLTMTNCAVTGNTARGSHSSGGGIYNTTGTLTNCTITGNSVFGSYSDGGGIYNSDGSLTLTNCAITGNSVSGTFMCFGGGIAYLSSGALTMTNCTIAGNFIKTKGDGSGGGIYNCSGALTLTNCTVAGNSAIGSTYCGGIENTSLSSGTVTLHNTIVSLNYGGDLTSSITSLSHSVLMVGSSFVTAPIFDANGNLTNLETLDLRLRETSWLINAGDNSLISESADLTGNSRIADGAVDIGAYEYQGKIKKREAVSLIVTTVEDSFDEKDRKTSLREAVFNAKMGETVTFSAALSGKTIVLGGSEILISEGITIDASALKAGITIDANKKSGVFYVTGGTETASVNLSHLTITGGTNNFAYTGGGIYNTGTLKLTNCSVVENFSTRGGGINNSGSLTLTNCVIAENSAEYGGGIMSYGDLTLTNCSVTRNSGEYDGGGIRHQDGTLTLTNCTVTENSVKRYGGGIYGYQCVLTLVICIITQNSSGGDGGGIYHSGTLTLTSCLITSNSANSYGGGIMSHSQSFLMINCTVAGNTAGYGGGIYNEYGNRYILTMTCYNSIIAQNTAVNSGNDIYKNSEIVSGYNNLSSWTGWHLSLSGNNFVYDPSAPLFTDPLNGDYTLCIDSQAINKGSALYVTIEIDLEGKKRVINNAVDLGAYEFKPTLDKPQDTDSSADGKTVTLTWDIVAGANQYVVTYADNASFNNAQKAVVSINSIKLENLNWETTYYFKISASDASEEHYDSPSSETFSISVGSEPGRLARPINVTFKIEGEYLIVTWNTVPLANRYMIYYSTDPTKMTEYVVSVKNSIVFSHLDQNQVYYFTVQASDSTESYLNSNSTAPSMAVMISSSTPTVSTGTLLTTIGYLADANIKYQWYRVDEQGVETRVTGKSSYRYKVTEADKGYRLKVVVTRNDFTSSVSTSVVSLSTPSILQMKRKGTLLAVTWRSVSGADSYKVTYSTDANFTASQTITTSRNNTQIDHLTLGATYYVKVQAFDSTGTYLDSAESSVKAITLDKLGAPEITSVKTVGSSITIDWTLVTGANRYVINYAKNADFTEYRSKTINSTTTSSVSLTGLTSGEIYYVRVQARSAENSYTSSEYSVRKITVNKLAAPTITTLTQSETSVSLAWNTVENANRYIVMYSSSANFTTVSKKVVNGDVSATITGLTAGNTYYFKVQARDSSGKFLTSEDSDVRSLALEGLLPLPACDVEDFYNDDFLPLWDSSLSPFTSDLEDFELLKK